MDEMPRRGRRRIALAKDRDLVAHAAVAKLAHAQPGIDGFREGDRLEIATERLDHEADHRTLLDVEAALSDQVFVHYRVEIGVVDNVVEVAIDVIVHPTRWDREE